MSDDLLVEMSPGSTRQDKQEIDSRRTTYYCLLLGVFLTILGARLWLIHYFALPVIFHDDWPVEGELFRKYVEGHLTFGYLISSYKGHRLFIPRLLLLGLFVANGRQWDPFVFMVAQAPIYALGITSLVAICALRMKNWGRAVLAILAIVVGGIPFGWENAVFACNIDFPIFTLFGILVIWFCWRYEALSWRWWVGVFLALANLFVMGGGIFSTIAIAMFTLLGLVLEPARRNIRSTVSLLVLMALIAFGFAIADTHSTHVVSVAQFSRSLAAVLAWPEDLRSILCIVIQAPLVLLAALLLIKRTPATDARWLPVIIGASFWIQAAATVYQRVEHLHASRYRDSWILLTISIVASLYFLIEASNVSRRYVYILVFAWTFVFLDGVTDCVFHDLPNAIAEDQSERLTTDNRVRQYLVTGNEGSLKDIIYREQIDSPSVRRMLPPELLNPNAPLIPIQEQQTENAESVDATSRGSYVAARVYGEYNKDVASLPKGIRLSYAVPKGTKEVTILVAGQVDLHVASYQIRTLIQDGLWRSITVPIDPNANSFDISASETALRGMNFSAPTISTHQALGRWTRDIVGDCTHNSLIRILLAGLVLTAGALIRMTKPLARRAPGQSLAGKLVGLIDARRNAGSALQAVAAEARLEPEAAVVVKDLYL